MATEKKAAVISADIVGSTTLKAEKRKKLQKVIDKFLAEKNRLYKDLSFEQYRGDSLQGILTTNKKNSLRLSLQMFCRLKMDNFAIRTAIGVGEINFKGKKTVTSDGSAFQLSGPLVDELKKRNELIAVAFDSNMLNEEWTTNNMFMNFILKRLSSRQAETLYFGLNELKQEEIAEKLKISQPSVHQRLKASGAEVLYSIIRRFETLLIQNY